LILFKAGGLKMRPIYANMWYCDELLSKPKPEKGIILVTGATGYVGGRLVPELLRRGYQVRVMVRSYSSDYTHRWPGAQVVEADALDVKSLSAALKDVHTTYYLIHSLLVGTSKFEKTDIVAAQNFRLAAETAGVKHMIYLGALGDRSKKLSPHLENRNRVASILSGSQMPVTVFRAGLIIGSGSAPYEILANLVKNSPVFFIPYWAKTKSQPIAIRDVIRYLVGAIESDHVEGIEYDIGGNEIMTYDEMLRILAGVQKKRRFFFYGLITNTALYVYLASLLTPVPGPITKALFLGCKNEVLCREHKIRELIQFEPRTYREALTAAYEKEKADKV
jgi:uncharacterized protein YbjT (DUF2867 family)